MKRKVKKLTDTFLTISEGKEDVAASVLSNFHSQRAVQPFVYNGNKSAVERFGMNCQATVHRCKNACGAGAKGLTNLLRRGVVAAGAQGPMAPEKVGDIIHMCNINLI